MTDKEIIKALECCCKSNSCEGCPLDYFTFSSSQCASELAIKSLDLINRQKAENKRLEKEVNLVSIQFQDLQERYEEAQAEIDRLKECPKCVYEYDGEITEYCVQGPCPNFKTVEQIKSEAVKEFAERLKEKFFETIRNYGLTKDVVEVCDIDNLVKEMVGDKE